VYWPKVYSGDGGDAPNEDTYAPMDLFDWLDVIGKLKGEGLALKEIGQKLGWSKDMVSLYFKLIDKVSTTILKLCKSHQSGRVDKGSTKVENNFTERWFRDSGLYDLNESYQEKLINAFISDKFNWNKSKVQSEANIGRCGFALSITIIVYYHIVSALQRSRSGTCRASHHPRGLYFD